MVVPALRTTQQTETHSCCTMHCLNAQYTVHCLDAQCTVSNALRSQCLNALSWRRGPFQTGATLTPPGHRTPQADRTMRAGAAAHSPAPWLGGSRWGWGRSAADLYTSCGRYDRGRAHHAAGWVASTQNKSAAESAGSVSNSATAGQSPSPSPGNVDPKRLAPPEGPEGRTRPSRSSRSTRRKWP